MNKKQTFCLWLGIIIFVIIGLVPPRPRIGMNAIPLEGRIDGAKLFTYWAMVAVVTGGLIYTFRDEPKDKEKEGTEE